MIFNYSCDKDKDDPIDQQLIEDGEIQYGVSRSELLNTISYQNISTTLRQNNNANATSRTDSLASQLTPENVIERIDLEVTHLNIYDNKEVLTAPIRTQGNYMRVLLSLTEGEQSNSYLLTYPNPDNKKVYYVSTLDGILLNKTVIGSDGVGFNTYYNDSQSISSRTLELCENTTYTTYSYGAHSFAWGNASECNYWEHPEDGTPPSQSTVLVACGNSNTSDDAGIGDTGDTGSGTSGGGTNDGNTNDDGFEGVPPKKGGLSDVDECVSNLDCETCNLGPQDLNDDCELDDLEVTINNINNCFAPNYLSSEQKQVLNNNPQVAFDAEAALTITCNPEVKEFLLDIIDEIHIGDQVNFDDLIILDSTFVNNQKMKCIYDKLKGLDNTFVKDIVINLFRSLNTSNIKISIGEIPTQLPTNTFTYTYTNYLKDSNVDFQQGKIKHIRINPDLIQNASSLEIARMLIHEIIHAELINRCIELGLIESMNTFGTTTFVDDPIIYNIEQVIFNLLLAQYNAFQPATSPLANPDWNHDFFNAFNYRTYMAQDLINVHPLLDDLNNDFLTQINNNLNSPTDPLYTISEVMNYISWIGLEGTTEYQDEIINTTGELDKKNFIENMSTNNYNKNCNN